jgi:hypothetical protein
MMNTAISLENRQLASAQTGRIHVFVLIDALGWEIIKDRPFLTSELPFRQPLETVLGYSCGAIPTILTGLMPPQTGRWNLFYYDPQGSPFRWLRWFSFLPERLLDNRYSRKVIKELGRRFLGMGPLFECGVSPRLLSRFNYVEKENIYATGGIPGSVSIFDLLSTASIPHRIYSYHYLSDAKILDQARVDIRSGDGRFFFVYLCEMDNFLHKRRDDEAAVAERLAWYDQQLRALFAVAVEQDQQATFTIVSDHGMTPVHSHYGLVDKIEALGFKMPEQYLAVYDSTMARYWFFDDAARGAITGELERTPCGRILSDAELTNLGIFFPDRRYGELVYLFDPGWLLAHSDFNGGGWQPTGMHGYHPTDSNSDAIFLSNCRPAHPMRTIADIFRCMEAAANAC